VLRFFLSDSDARSCLASNVLAADAFLCSFSRIPGEEGEADDACFRRLLLGEDGDRSECRLLRFWRGPPGEMGEVAGGTACCVMINA
jgi:hypothetical protein